MSVRAVFLWHLHQPEYRDPQTGQPILPLGPGSTPRAPTPTWRRRWSAIRRSRWWRTGRPSLLAQLEAYVAGTQDVDEQLARKPADALTPEERAQRAARSLLRRLERLGAARLALFRAARQAGAPTCGRSIWSKRQTAFNAQELRDLQVHFVLAWMGFAARREEPLVGELIAKERGYTEEEKVAAVDAQRRIASRIVPRWRAPRRARAGRDHLLALCTIPSCRWSPTPSRPGAPCRRWRCRRASSYPQDAREQVRRGLERTRAAFGQVPHGMWPFGRLGVRPKSSISSPPAESAGARPTRECSSAASWSWAARCPTAIPRTTNPYLAGADHAVTVLFRDRELSDPHRLPLREERPARGRPGPSSRASPTPSPRRSSPWRSTERIPGSITPPREKGSSTPSTRASREETSGRCFPATSCASVRRARASRASTPGAGSIRTSASEIGHPEDNAAWTLLGEAREALARGGGEGRAAA